MNKFLFSERLSARRKECGYNTQYALAEEYNKRFPSSRKNRKEENAENSSGILGTIKHYENGNYSGSPKLDIVDNLCKILECDVDYLLGNIGCKKHDIQFIQDQTGLSETAINKLCEIKIISEVIGYNEIDLNTINLLLEEMEHGENNIIHAISTYIRSIGLSEDIHYFPDNGKLYKKKIISSEINSICISAKSNIFDNLLLMDIQKHLINLKNNLKKTPNSKKAPDTN